MIHACLAENLSAAAAHRAAQMLVDLASFQEEVNQAPTYAERVKAAAEQWDSKRKVAVIRTVRELLHAMCPGNARCMFCEDSAASEIEHFHPKGLYPELVFEWANFLYACGDCNGPAWKGSRLKIRKPDGTIAQQLGHRKGKPSLPPDNGELLLINPRYEDPLKLLDLDLPSGVFCAHSPTGFERDRADHTIEVLGLNERENLIRARQNTYTAAQDHLEKIASLLPGGGSADAIMLRKDALLRHTHRTVWEEMKRQRGRYAELKRLFEAAPDAVTW